MVTSLSNEGTLTGPVSDVDQDDEYYILTEHRMNQRTVQLRRSTRVTRPPDHYGDLVSH